MLRLAVLVLLLANAGYSAWSHGLLAVIGAAPAQQSEPQRLAQQIQPEALRILSPEEARRLDTVAAQAARAAECLQAGLLADSQVTALKQALDAWPAGSWKFDAGAEPARWIIYMGRYDTAEHVARKKAELRQLGVSFEAVGNPALEPGLSLGGFATQQAATQQLQVLAQKGVHTAKVVQERAESHGQLLRLAAVDDALRPRLDELKTALAGKPLQPCR
jgi:hypothetical protein